MVTVPTYQRNVSLRPDYQQGIDVRASPEAFGADIGRGMQQAAKGVSEVADAVAGVQALLNETEARNARNAYMQDADKVMYGEGGYALTQGKQAIDGYSDLERKLGEIRQKHAASLTPEQQAIFNRVVDVDETNRKRTALQHRGQETKRFAISTHEAGVNSFLEEAVRSRRDPQQSMKYLASSETELESLMRLQGQPDEAIKLKRTEIRDSYFSRVATEMVNEDPVAAVDYVQKNIGQMSPDAANKLLVSLARPLGQAAGQDAISAQGVPAIEATVSRIIGVESGGKADAENPKSSASGLGQFIDETWLAVIKKHRPDVAMGKSDSELLALKTDPTLGREMTRRYTEDNAAALRKAGLPVTAGNLYLSHFAGPAGARAVLTSDPDRAVVDILGPAVVNANGFLNKMSARDLVAWASEKMGGAPAGASGERVVFSERTERVLASLPGYMQSQVREIASGQVQDYTAKQAANWKAEQAAVVNSYRLRIETTDPTITTQEILADPILDDGDKASLVSRFNEKFGDLRQAQANVAAFNAGSLAVDPYTEQGRKAVDGVWSHFVAAAKESGNAEMAAAALPQLVKQTGVIPTPVFNGLRGALAGNNVKDVASGLSLAVALSDADPAAFGKRDGGGAIQDAVASYRHFIGDLGMSPEHAAQAIIDSRDPAKREARDAMVKSEPAKKWLDAETKASNVVALFPEADGWFSSPALGDNPVQEAAMLSEYREILEQTLFDVAGDFDQAKALAGDRFKRRYGVTEFSISGAPTITRLPIEKTYPPGVDGGHGYVQEQAKAELSKEGITAKEIYFIADNVTERDVEAGKAPRYQVFYSDEDGILEQFNGHMTFTAPSPEAIKAAKIKKSEERMKENREQTELGRDRDRMLDRHLEGYPLPFQLPAGKAPTSTNTSKP